MKGGEGLVGVGMFLLQKKKMFFFIVGQLVVVLDDYMWLQEMIQVSGYQERMILYLES